MPDAIEMNVSLLVHILLDAEGQGLWGVQGNNFVNTVGYLNQYIAQLPKDAHGKPEIPGLKREQLNVLSAALLDLATHENEQIFTPTAKIDHLITQTTERLLQLKTDEDYMLPGGWRNKDGGHAMIYQFRKTNDDPPKLRFLIYNSGAGLEEHDKLSTDKHEAYFPVKVYEIPMENLNQEEFEAFIHRLIVPRFVGYQDPITKNSREPYDETKLYQDIKASMPFLNDTTDFTQKAQLVSASTVFPEHFNTITTPGQVSGTCSQRSIHQMLKVNFENLKDYQRFIFNFEVSALKDFIYQPSKEAPQKRSQGIIDLIELGIDNLLKILQEPNVFSDDEKNAFHAELNLLREEATALILIPLSREEQLEKAREQQIEEKLQSMQERGSIKDDKNKEEMRLFYREEATKIKARDEQYECKPSLTGDFSSVANAFVASLSKQIPLQTLFNDPQTILTDLQALLERCQKSTMNNPPDLMWVIDQIDHVINRLPIPNNEQEFQEGIELYNNLNAEQLKQMEEMLAKLQDLYLKTMTNKAGLGVYPNLHVTQCSFFALQDYCSTQYNKKAFTHNPVSAKNNLHRYLGNTFYAYLDHVRHCPNVATNNPLFDQRIMQLKKTYPESASLRFQLMDIYHELLKTEPDCQKALKILYDAHSNDVDEKIKIELRKVGNIRQVFYEELYYLFENLDEQGNFLVDSPIHTVTNEQGEPVDFQPLLAKIQSIIRMESTLVRTLGPFMQQASEQPTKLGIKLNNRNSPYLTSFSNGEKDSSVLDFIISNIVPHQSKDARSITSLKYHLNQDSFAQKALLYDDPSKISSRKASKGKAFDTLPKLSANEIQLLSISTKTDKSPLNKDDFFVRQLLQLRLSPQNQIALTLSYFMEHMDRLSDYDNQRYVEANLFEPGLLIDLLSAENFTETTNFLTCFDNFIQSGMDAFNDSRKNITQESFFFVRLACYVNRYILEYGQVFENAALIKEGRQRLRNNLALINEQISVYTHLAGQNNSSILASLHQDRFLILMSLASDEKDIIAFQEQILASYFYVQSHENTVNPDDKATLFERQRVERLFQSYLQQTDKTLLEKNPYTMPAPLFDKRHYGANPIAHRRVFFHPHLLT